MFKEHTTIVLGFFFSFRLLSFVWLLTYYVHYSFFFSCGCEVLVWIVSLIYLNEVAKSCPIPKAVCPRGRSFPFSPPALSARGSSHAEVLHFMPQLRKWEMDCVADRSQGRPHSQCVFLWYNILPAGIPVGHEVTACCVLTVQYTWRAFPWILKAQGESSILNDSCLQPVLITVFEASKLIAA